MRAFNFKGGGHYCDIMSNIWKVKRPHWMGVEFYGELFGHSESPTFLQMLKANKENMKSLIGGSLYVGGNVSIGTYRDRVVKYDHFYFLFSS